jgi:hypothetical protein
VREVHVWVGYTCQAKERPRETPPVPAELQHDLWLGPVPHRPYHPAYPPLTWCYWWAFGAGPVGVYGCHYMDLPRWALNLR